MWTKAFWLATLERMIRGGAAALGGALVAGDWIMDLMNIGNWEKGLTLFVGGALTSLLLALAGEKFGSGHGPSFTGREYVTEPV